MKYLKRSLLGGAMLFILSQASAPATAETLSVSIPPGHAKKNLAETYLVALGSPKPTAMATPAASNTSPAVAPSSPSPSPSATPVSNQTLQTKLDDFVNAQPVPHVVALAALNNPDISPVDLGQSKSAIGDIGQFIKNGKLQPNVAVQVVPADLVTTQWLNWDEYQNFPDQRLFGGHYSLLRRLLWSDISLATVPDNNSGVRAAYGVQLKLYDGSDWRENYKALAAFQARLPSVDNYYSKAERERLAADVDELAKGIFKNNFAWNAPQLALGFSQTFDSPNSTPQSDLQRESNLYSISGAYPLGSDWQALASARYAYHFAGAPSDEKATPPTNDWQVAGSGLQLTFRREDLRVLFTGGYGFEVNDPQLTHSVLGLNIERPVNQQWVDFGVKVTWDAGVMKILGTTNLDFSTLLTPKAP